MRSKMPMINATILSHVSMIDIEGRYGLQGSHLPPLLSYFSDFLKKYSQADTYKKLAFILEDLAQKYQHISTLDSSPNIAKLIHVVQSYANKILTLAEGEAFYLPGGWVNRSGLSHGIIFAFRKNIGDESYDFLIFNGGAGLAFHDEIAATSSRQFYPVKIYKIPDLKHNRVELANHLQRLILPNIVHVEWRKKHTFDAKILYDQIQLGMTALKAQLIDARTCYSPMLATQGISSGTCGQACIQQMVKIYLNDLHAFQILMVHYKYDTLMDYMSTYPMPYSKVMYELIQKSFENLMRIVHTSPAFTEEEKQIWFDKLQLSKTTLTYDEKARTTRDIIIPPRPRLDIPNIQSSTKIASLKDHDDILESINITHLSFTEKLSYIISTEVTEKNSSLIFKEINKFLLEIPLPESPEAFEGAPLAWCASFTTEEWQAFIEQLNLLARLYYDPYDSNPSYFIGQWSLFTLIDYATYQQAKLDSSNTYAIHQAISPIMQGYQFFFQRAFFLATRHPDTDKRLLQIQQLYPPEIKPLYPEKEPSIQAQINKALSLYPWYQLEKIEEYLQALIGFGNTSQEKIEFHEILHYLQGYSELDYYRTLVRQYPEEQKLIENIYQVHRSQEEPIASLFYEQIEALDLQAVYCLFNIILPSSQAFKTFLRQQVLLEESLGQSETLTNIHDECVRINDEIKAHGLQQGIYQKRHTQISHEFDAFKQKYLNIFKTETLLREKFGQLSLQDSIATCHADQIGYALLRVSERSPMIQEKIKYHHMFLFSITRLKDKVNPTYYCEILSTLLLDEETQQNDGLFLLLGTMYYLLSNPNHYDHRLSAKMTVEQVIEEIKMNLPGGPDQIVAEEKTILSNFHQLSTELKWIKSSGLNKLLSLIQTHRETSETIYTCLIAPLRSLKSFPLDSFILSKHNIFHFRTFLTCLYQPHVILKAHSRNVDLRQNLLRSPIYTILKPDIPNHQLFQPYPKLPNSHTLSCEAFEPKIKQWQYLSLSNALRPILTLSYFSFLSRIHQLTDLNAQILFEANLMEPHALIQWAQKDPASLKEKIQYFCTLGMKFFQNNESKALSQEGVFLLRIQFFIYRYLFLSSHDATYLSELMALYQHIESLLEHDVNQPIKFRLSLYYFLTGMFLLEHHPTYPVDLQKLFSAYIVIQYATNDNLSQIDSLTQMEFNAALYQLQKQLQAAYPTLYRAMKELSAKQVQKAPPDLVASSLLALLGISKETLCLVSLNQTLVIFPTQSHIMFMKQPSGWVVQRRDYQLNLTLKRQLPLIYQDNHTLIWQRIWQEKSTDTCEVIVERYHQNVFQCDKRGYLQTITQDGELTFDEHDQIFAQFENPAFIISIAYDDGRRTTCLERYGLNFEQNQAGEIIFLNNPNYRLLPFENTPFQDEVACLMLENRQKNTQKCLVPRQVFYIDYRDSAEIGSFHRLIHDRESLLLYPYKQEKDFCYKDSETYAIYDIHKNELIPHSTEDALYLCYVYIATHETPKAWSLMNQLSLENKFQGFEDEYMMLYWIVNLCPVTLCVDNIDQQNTSQTLSLDTIAYVGSTSAERIVCQLKAISLLCMWFDQGNEIEIPQSQHKFGDFLQHSLWYLYEQYQKNRRELPVHWLLNDAECLSLLNMIAIQNPNIAITAFRYEKIQLEMKYYWVTEQKIKALSSLQKTQQKRLQTLTETIENIGDLFSTETGITHQNIALNQTHLYGSFPKTFFDHPLESTAQLEQDALKALSTNMTQDELCKYFYIYASITAQPEKESARQKLLDVSRALLVGYAHDRENGLIFAISNLLYRMIHAPHIFSTLKHDESFSELLKRYLDTEPPPVKKPILFRYTKSILYRHNALLQSVKETTEQIAKLPKPLPLKDVFLARPSTPSPWISIENEDRSLITENPIRAGERKMALRLEKISIAQHYVHEFDKAHWLHTALEAQTILQSKVTLAFEEALTFAQQGLARTPKDRRKIAARLIEPISSKEELLSLYVGREYATYRTKTALDDTEILQLQQLIHEAITLEIECQWLSQFITLLQGKNTSPITLLEHISRKNLGAEDPLLMTLQRSLGFLLKPNQIDAFLKLVHPPAHQYMLSLPMGSGKTKVLLPLLGNHQANGYELSMILVPAHLLETNYQDYQQIILKKLGKKLFLFKFDSEKPCNASVLKRLYEQLESMISYQSLWITSDESIQALALKYNELLYLSYQPGTHPEQYQDELFFLHQILKLLRTRANVIIDEVHEVLSPNRSLNYTLGTHQFIPHPYIERSIQFFKFIKPYHFVAQEDVIEALLSDLSSPLMNDLPAERRQTIFNYLSGQANPNETDFIKQLSPALKDQLAFYKLHFNRHEFDGRSLYEHTRDMRLHVNYGSSKRHDLSALQKAIAIPYSSNNKSLEGSRFGCYWITVHCTILMLLEMGMNQALLKELIEIWKKSGTEDICFRDKINHYLREIDINLANIDVNHPQSLNQILFKMNQHVDLLFAILEHYLLPQIELDSVTLSSDAYHHVDLYHTAICTSGTLEEAVCYHPNFVIDNHFSNGNNEYLLTLLKSKHTPIETVDFTTPETLLQNYYQRKTAQPFSTIIDLSARFSGIENAIVASSIADFVAEHQPYIRYILYFNEQDRLCALSVSKPRLIVDIGPTDTQTIFEKLDGCTPDHYVTYFDQTHSFGMDIRQKSDAFGLILADDKHPIFQGCLRMRDLEGMQTISIILPTDCPIESLDELVNKIERDHHDKLRHAAIKYTLSKLENVIYQNLMERVLALESDDINTQIRYAKAFQSIFIKRHGSNSLYDAYGAISEIELTAKYLEHCSEQLLKKWATCLHKADIQVNNLSKLREKMQQIIILAQPYCAATTYQSGLSSLSTIVHNKTLYNTSQTMQMQIQEKTVDKSTCLYTSLEIRHPVSHPNKPLKFKPTMYQTLNAWCATDIFDENLFASNNYMLFYEGQLNPLEVGLPPVHCIYTRVQHGKLAMHLISIEEASTMMTALGDERGWISTLNNQILAGKKNVSMRHFTEHKRLMEQIYYFNGMLLELSQHADERLWLPENHALKLDFYETKLALCRFTSRMEFNTFKKSLQITHPRMSMHTHLLTTEEEGMLNEAEDFVKAQHWQKAMIGYFRVLQRFPQSIKAHRGLQAISDKDYAIRYAIISILIKYHPDLLEQKISKQWLSIFSFSSSEPFYTKLFYILTQHQFLAKQDNEKIKNLIKLIDLSLKNEMIEKIDHLVKTNPQIQHNPFTHVIIDLLKSHLDGGVSHKI